MIAQPLAHMQEVMIPAAVNKSLDVAEQWMASRNLMDPQTGQWTPIRAFDPNGNLSRMSDAAVHKADAALRMFGMDPSRYSHSDKLMMLGGLGGLASTPFTGPIGAMAGAAGLAPMAYRHWTGQGGTNPPPA